MLSENEWFSSNSRAIVIIDIGDNYPFLASKSKFSTKVTGEHSSIGGTLAISFLGEFFDDNKITFGV